MKRLCWFITGSSNPPWSFTAGKTIERYGGFSSQPCSIIQPKHQNSSKFPWKFPEISLEIPPSTAPWGTSTLLPSSSATMRSSARFAWSTNSCASLASTCRRRTWRSPPWPARGQGEVGWAGEACKTKNVIVCYADMWWNIVMEYWYIILI